MPTFQCLAKSLILRRITCNTGILRMRLKCKIIYFQEKEKEVAELIQVIKSLTPTEEDRARPYGRMADSLEEAWNDLNVQLEGRRILLDTSVAFHHSVEQVHYFMIYC